MYSNVIQKLWVVKWKAVAGCFLLFWAFKELNFDMQEPGCLLSLFVCLWKVTLCRQGEDLTEEALFCQRVDGGLDIGALADMFMWQNHLTALTLHRQTSSKEAAYTCSNYTARVFIAAAKCTLGGCAHCERKECNSGLIKGKSGRDTFNTCKSLNFKK